MNNAPLWAQAIEAALLIASAMLVLAASWALARMDDFFQRLHPPALGYTLGAWCACLACIVHFAAVDGEVQWRFILIAALLAITASITSILLARAALFRGRRSPARRTLPPSLRPLASMSASQPEVTAKTETTCPAPATEGKNAAAPTPSASASDAAPQAGAASAAPHPSGQAEAPVISIIGSAKKEQPDV